MKTNRTLLFILGIMLPIILSLVNCTPVLRPVPTPDSKHTPASPCPINYSGEWQKVVGSQVAQMLNKDFLDEVTTIVGQRYPDLIAQTRDFQIFALQHPDDAETLYLEYDVSTETHGSIMTVLIKRSGKKWEELARPSYQSNPWVMILDLDLIGFVRECNRWALYVGVRNTEYQLGARWPKDTTFYRSYDDGQSWEQVSSYSPSVYWVPLSSPILPPTDAELATAHYNERDALLTQFAWTVKDRTLYAFTYSATATPIPTPYPSRTPTPEK